MINYLRKQNVSYFCIHMKNINPYDEQEDFSIFCLGVMGILPCVAQQALWGGSDIVSPELQEDGRVTFRIYAPEARTVEVQGDFLATQLYETPFGKRRGRAGLPCTRMRMAFGLILLIRWLRNCIVIRSVWMVCR